MSDNLVPYEVFAALSQNRYGPGTSQEGLQHDEFTYLGVVKWCDSIGQHKIWVPAFPKILCYAEGYEEVVTIAKEEVAEALRIWLNIHTTPPSDIDERKLVDPEEEPHTLFVDLVVQI